MAAITARGLGKTFGFGATAVRALLDVDLDLEAGRVVALIGPSGSGKSTLVKALGLVEAPDVGRVWLDGEVVVADGVIVADVGRLRRTKLGFVFQKANLVSFLTARENVEIACELGGHPHPRGRADELLGWLGMTARATSWPETLSGGEQQRVAVARALANGPTLVLADEPTAALDRDRGRSVMELFRRVAHEQGAAVLVVTHDHRALDVFDEVYAMEDGRLGPGSPSALGVQQPL